MTQISDQKIKHLEMLQRVIERTAGESARMKQFCLASIAALASTASALDASALAVIAALLTLIFWALDAKYLCQERWFRETYDSVRKSSETVDFNLNPSNEVRLKQPLRKAATAWSVASLYGALFAINVGLALIIGLTDKTV